MTAIRNHTMLHESEKFAKDTCFLTGNIMTSKIGKGALGKLGLIELLLKNYRVFAVL